MLRAAKLMWAEPALEHPLRAGRHDLVLAAIVLATAALEALLRPDVSWPVTALALGFAFAAAMWIRRRQPLGAVVVAFGALLLADLAAAVLAAAPVVLWTATAVLFLLYTLVRWGSGRDIILGTGLVALEYVVAVATGTSGLQEAVGGAAVLLLAATVGLAVRYRAVARAQLIESAKLQQRELFARELHDTIAHHVSAIAIQAQAGLVLARSAPPGAPPGTSEALKSIEREAALALSEMRTMVGGLRRRSSQATPPAGHTLTDIENLAGAADGRLRVDVTLRGALTGLSPSLESTLYRAAQESVTNARRHARGATKVAVAVTGKASAVELSVEDDGVGTPPSAPPGFGLVGMAERVHLLGGELTAGPSSGHGWHVRVVLPRKLRGGQ
ncbi:sensor histidine kinase [Arthrobacter sp.]|uniref:sensor histidine kinase n=1 Tax=Arthrobacter sp. TaxID=1667 RepID=UPI0026DEBB04|nr:sensor histidine kinase [Arthrobacter sp.]MDO5753751.1 sensor histidine kinase [Arthrobacter sp.]